MKEDKTTVCLNMSYELKEQIEEMAKKKNIQVAALMRLAISEYLERNK